MKTLEKVEQKIDDFDRDLKKLWVFVKDNMAASNEKTSKLESQVENVELSVGFAHDKLLSLEKENKQLRDSVVDIQARSMRDNLVWGGIHDDRNETQQQTEDKIRGFMCEVWRWTKRESTKYVLNASTEQGRFLTQIQNVKSSPNFHGFRKRRRSGS